MKEGDRFNYGPWSGACIATYTNGVLRLYRESRGKNTDIMSWKCKSVGDTEKLVYGEQIKILWDGGKGELKMKATNNNTFEVMHGTTAYHFTRIPEKEEKEVSA